MRAAKEGGSLLPPKHILNAPTTLMKSEGYGRGYAYDHDRPRRFPARTIFRKRWAPDLLRSARARLRARDRKRLDYWAKLRQEAAGLLGKLRCTRMQGGFR
jgi:putative ATPase